MLQHFKYLLLIFRLDSGWRALARLVDEIHDFSDRVAGVEALSMNIREAGGREGFFMI